MSDTPNTIGDLFTEIKLRNVLKVRHWINNNLDLFKSDNWQEIMFLLRQAGILTNWNTIFCPIDTPEPQATRLAELDTTLLHPEELRTIKEV